MRTATLLALGALAATAATPVSAQTAPSVPAETLLSLTATGESTRVPDIAIISAGVVTQAAEARAALTANNSQMTRVVAALKKAGIAERDIQTSNINLNPQYSYEERKPPQLIGYQAANTVTVKLRKLASAGDVIDALVTEGANQVNGPTFGLDKPEDATNEARLDAIKKARSRADLYAGAAGLRVKRIVSISEGGGYQPPYPMPKMMVRAEAADAAAAPPVEAGEVGTNVTVTVVFELQ
ncbi:SIMPL domain-containing protein [Sphingosinicella xenopeptidilytica]|uniref:SIMPL domain-containing protein n=1 Tax=Sphingosinicella xenopeptidilytica TaxID=364098 RepID=A0ABW3CA98_SPHXN